MGDGGGRACGRYLCSWCYDCGHELCRNPDHRWDVNARSHEHQDGRSASQWDGIGRHSAGYLDVSNNIQTDRRVANVNNCLENN